MKELSFASLAETEKWAREFARSLKRPCLVLLDGEMGAGKTQLVKWMVESLGGTPASSPTFAVHQSYELSSGGTTGVSATVEHVDLYRLENAADLESTGFWDLFRDPSALIFVEWAERIPGRLWPEGIQKLHIKISAPGQDSESRRILLS